MATREENLKKINEELEKLADEELEEIAGGDAPKILYCSVEPTPEIKTPNRPDEAGARRRLI